MNKFLRLSLLTVAVGFLFSTFSVSESRGQDVLREILKRMDAHNAALQTLQAGVTMAKYDSVLKVYDKSIGTTSYIAKSKKEIRRIRVDWTSPAEEYMTVNGDDYEVYRPRLNQVIFGKAQRSNGRPEVGNALAFINMSRAQLELNYETAFLGVEDISGGVHTWRIQLTPKAAANYKIAELWVDSDGMPRQAKITAPNNDTTTVLLSNIRKNVTVKKDAFKLNYPDTVKKIKG